MPLHLPTFPTSNAHLGPLPALPLLPPPNNAALPSLKATNIRTLHTTQRIAHTSIGMGQSLSQAASSGQLANRSTMGKRITAPNTTADTQPTSTTTTLPTLTPTAIRTQLKQLTTSLTPSLVDSIKRRDEAAIAQFEALHSQLSALYNNPSLPDEYEVRVHELWNRAETLRTAVNVVEGLKERGKVAVIEMDGEGERDKLREQARARVEEVEGEDRQQRKRAVELQKLAARRAAEQSAARSKQSKLAGRVRKVRKNGASNKPQHKQRKAVSDDEDDDDEDDAEEDDARDAEQQVEDSDRGAARIGLVQLVAATSADDVEEEETLPPPTKKTKVSPRTSQVTRGSRQQQRDSQSATKPVKSSTPQRAPPPRTPTLTATSPMPKTYTRMTATVTPAAAQPTPIVRSSPHRLQSTLRSADKATQPATADSFITPAAAAATTAAAGTPSKHKKAKQSHAADGDRDQQRVEQQRLTGAKPPTAAASRLNLTRLTAAMTPERKKPAQQQQQVEQPGPGVGRTGKRRRSAAMVREEQYDVYDTFDA